MGTQVPLLAVTYIEDPNCWVYEFSKTRLITSLPDFFRIDDMYGHLVSWFIWKIVSCVIHPFAILTQKNIKEKMF